MFTRGCFHIFEMQSCRVISMMRTMKVDQTLDLEELHHSFDSKFYRGRPEMLLLKLTNGRSIQAFRNGTVQILGAIPPPEAERMRNEFIGKLQSTKKLRMCKVTNLTLKNMVVIAQLESAVSLAKIATTDYQVFCELELFPAVLIRKWHPAHVALFRNGKVVITGIQNEQSLVHLLQSLSTFLTRKSMIV